jgi:hypothetical protein
MYVSQNQKFETLLDLLSIVAEWATTTCAPFNSTLPLTCIATHCTIQPEV